MVVRSWDRDQVRVQATHSERERIDMQTADMTLRIRSRASRGPSSLVDYQITVPRWMAVNLSGTYLESTIEGTAAEVNVETVHGNIRVAGGSGTVVVKSIEGLITIEGSCSLTGAGLAADGSDFKNIPYLAFKGDYTGTSAQCQATVDAVKAAGGKADYIQLDQPGVEP